jgi:hypothetical protein
VAGRQPNTLLVALTQTGGTFDVGPLTQWAQQQGQLPVFPYWYLKCLTPGARAASATAVQHVDHRVFSIEVAEIDSGTGKEPWAPGVHLFSVYVIPGGGDLPSTIASAVIDEDVKREESSTEWGMGFGWS